MNSTDIHALIMEGLYTSPIILCVFTSSLFFCIFRQYHASVPLCQNILVNVFFYHLSFFMQAGNILNATELLIQVVFHIDDPFVSCTLYRVRQFQQTLSGICILLISISYFIEHFKFDLYMKIQNPYMSLFSFSALVLVSSVFSIYLAFYCNFLEVCAYQCYKNHHFKFGIIVLLPMVLINVVIVMDKICKTNFTNWKKFFMFPKILPFHGPFQHDPKAIEIQIISPIGSRSLPTPPSSASQTHVAFSAGLITIIAATIGTAILTFIFQNTTASSAFSGQSKSVLQTWMSYF
jgi:hypothetical protein